MERTKIMEKDLAKVKYGEIAKSLPEGKCAEIVYVGKINEHDKWEMR